MARRLGLMAFAVALVLCALGPMRGFVTQQREVIDSVPGGYTGIEVPLRISAGEQLCSTAIPYGDGSEIARFGAASVGSSAAPSLSLTLRETVDSISPRARWRPAPIEIAGGWTERRIFNISLPRPPAPLFGTFCLRNRGDAAIDLLGTSNGRGRARSEILIDGVVVPEKELTLTLLHRGTKSLADQWGQVLSHSASFWPGSRGWLWVLTIFVLLGVPWLVVRALATALADEPAGVSRPAPSPLPFPRLRARLALIDPRWAVAVIVLLATLWFIRWGVLTHAFQDDEDQYVYLGRWLADQGPSQLFNFDLFGRGLQRLEIWQIAFWQWLLPHAPSTLIAAHATNALAFASTAIPVYLLSRGVGVRQWLAVLAATLCVVTPFAVVTTSFLTESLAYPATAWVLWATWSAAVKPSWRSDLGAIALVVVAGLARSSMLVLLVVPPLVFALHDLSGSGLASSWRDRVRASWRRHRLVWTLTAIGALVLLSRAIGADVSGGLIERSAGTYGTPFNIDLSLLAEKSARLLSRVVVGTGVLPAMLALPWLIKHLARPDDRRQHALAATLCVTTLALLYSLGTAGVDERYILYLTPAVLIPAAAAISRFDLRPWAMAASGVAIGVLLLRVPWPDRANDYDYFTYPVGMFYRRVLGQRLDQFVPGDIGTALTVLPLLVIALGVAIAVAARHPSTAAFGPTTLALIGAVCLLVAGATQYSLDKYVYTAGNGSGPTLSDRAWIDKHAPGDGRVAEFAIGGSNDADGNALWSESQFYNDRLSQTAIVGSPGIAITPGDEYVPTDLDRRTGAVSPSLPLSRLVVQSTDAGVPQLRGRPIARAGYLPLQLIEPSLPLHLAWYADGLSPAGWTPADGRATVRVYGRGLAPRSAHCAALFLAAPGDASVRYRIRTNAVSRRGTIAQGSIQRIALPLPGLPGRRVDIAIVVDGGGTTPEGRGGARLAAVAVDDRCGARAR